MSKNRVATAAAVKKNSQQKRENDKKNLASTEQGKRNTIRMKNIFRSLNFTIV